MTRALAFLNLLDAGGNLSISNVAVIVCVTKLALAAQFTGVDAVAMLGTLMNYAHKRSAINNADS